MTFDALKTLIAQKQRYEGLRGRECRSSGKCFPLTTNIDVYTFGKEWLRRTYIDTEPSFGEKVIIGVSTMFGGEMPSDSYEYERGLLKEFMPSLWTALGAPNDIFQFNSLFWPQAVKYTIARNAVLGLPGTWTMMGEAVKESVADRIQNAKDVVDAIMPDINWSKVALFGVVGFVGYKALTK